MGASRVQEGHRGGQKGAREGKKGAREGKKGTAPFYFSLAGTLVLIVTSSKGNYKTDMMENSLVVCCLYIHGMMMYHIIIISGFKKDTVRTRAFLLYTVDVKN